MRSAHADCFLLRYKRQLMIALLIESNTRKLQAKLGYSKTGGSQGLKSGRARNVVDEEHMNIVYGRAFLASQ